MNMQDLFNFLGDSVQISRQRVWNGHSFMINYGKGRLFIRPDETAYQVFDRMTSVGVEKNLGQMTVEEIAGYIIISVMNIKFIHIGKAGFVVASNGKTISILTKGSCELIHDVEAAKSVQNCDDSNQDILIDYLSEKSQVVAGMVYEMV